MSNNNELANFIDNANVGDIIIHNGNQYKLVNNHDKRYPRVVDVAGQYSVLDLTETVPSTGRVLEVVKKVPTSVKVAKAVTAGLSIYGGYKLGNFIGEKLAESICKKYMK